MRNFWRRNHIRKVDRRAIAYITKALAIPAYRQSLALLNKEIARGRRFQRPLIIASVRLNGDSRKEREEPAGGMPPGKNDDKDETLSSINKIEFALCGPVFRDCLRDTDITTYDYAQNQFVIVLPETSKSQAIQTFTRLKRTIGETVSNRLAVGFAEFPTDGLNIEDLLEYARKLTCD